MFVFPRMVARANRKKELEGMLYWLLMRI